PQLPVYFLLNNRTLAAGSTMGLPLPTIGRRLFSWWGDSRVFLAMVTSLEDAVNADNDIQSGLVPAFLVVEDSPSYCTRLLIVLYNHIFEQVRFAMRHAAIRENERMARMRMRPKVLVAYNYKDALHYVNKYGNALLGVISDIEFGRNGTLCHTAGLDLAHHIQEHHPAIPILFNSTRGSHKTSARKLNALFHNKTTDDLNETVSLFLREKVGFGEFIFRGPEGNRAATVTTFTELAATVQKLPSSLVAAYVRDDSIRRWLSCQGERSFAQRVGLLCAGEGARDDDELSAAFIDELQQYIDNRHRGKIIALDDVGRLSSRYISSLCSGSLGGKGRGVSFLNTIVQNMDPANQPPGLTIKTPLTAIIGIEEFERLIGLPHIKACMHEQAPYEKIRQAFLQAQLSERVMSRLRVFVHQVSTPVAVRSSSLLEDSVSQPFAGVFETYILPNSHPDAHARLRQLVESIKLVFASLFQPEARAYFASIGQKPEHDRMAVVLQQLVGNRFGRWFYPHISGVAQTYNFYPVGHMKPEDGYAIMAFGLGVYVVEGRTGHRFSPRHPQIDFGSIRDTLNASQVQFYAVDLENRSPDFVRDGEKAALSLRSVSEARENGSLLHCASVYNPDNDQIESDMRKPGPLIVNFADILKHHYLPLAESIDTVLTTLQQATENPVELEFAVELEKKTRGPSALYLLQVRPLVGEQLGHSLSDIAYEPEQVVLFSETALGNGKINDIYDVVIIKPHSYDRLQTKEMVGEVEYFNRLLVDESRQYILIGPGRWGTRDPSLGIPVVWSQIANARAVVEVGLSDTAFDPSQGSHFFHNLTAMNVAYLAVNQSRPREYLRWEFFDTQQAVHETSHFRHLRFEKPLTVQIDGRSKKSVITRS
ncbi:MAG: PEP/pyruvate-binding domain-containing protein, partial [Chitinispirillaceae bacterium]